MRRGHRRTQSANLNPDPPHPPPPPAPPAHPLPARSHIAQLITKCEAKLKEKVCSIDQLEPAEEDPLFNFGKGGKGWEQQRREWQEELRAIPEKQRVGAGKRKGESESQGRKRQRSTLQSVLKNSNREVSRSRIPFNEAIDRIIREKMGMGGQAKKASFYEAALLHPKSNKHKKAPSLK